MIIRSLFDSGHKSQRLRFSAAVIALACLVLIGWTVPAAAEDEDSSTSVYLVFDPETGEFVTSDDPNHALPGQTGLESTDAPSSSHAAPAGATAQNAASDGGKALPLAIVVVAILGGLAFLMLRSSAKKAT